MFTVQVEGEGKQYPEKYGLGAQDIFYSCQTCKIAANFHALTQHLKVG